MPMAPTSQRNPNWEWEEQVLAFELYLKLGKPAGGNHPDVVALSEYLRAMPLHPPEVREATFRNPNGVGRKLADIHTHAPGYMGGPTSGSKLDTEVWTRFGADLAAVQAEAERIRADVALMDGLYAPADDEDEVEQVHEEGRLRYRVHRQRERSAKLRAEKVKAVLAHYGDGLLRCEACAIVLAERYGDVGGLVYECHHLVPLSVSGPTTTKLSDVALLCPTCHRVAHRIDPWPDLAALQAHVLSG